MQDDCIATGATRGGRRDSGVSHCVTQRCEESARSEAAETILDPTCGVAATTPEEAGVCDRQGCVSCRARQSRWAAGGGGGGGGSRMSGNLRVAKARRRARRGDDGEGGTDGAGAGGEQQAHCRV